jgi:hypothetical protein
VTIVPPELRLSAQRALLGAICPEIRLVKVKLVGSTIVMTIVAERQLSERAAEGLSIAAAEIIADFSGCDRISEELVISDAELPNEDVLAEGWVFQRAES